MDKVIKNIINKTIEREYDNVTCDFGQALKRNPELAKEYDESGNSIEDLRKKIMSVLPDEYKELLDKFEDVCVWHMVVESKVVFKEGLLLGLTELNYLQELGQEIAFV